MMKLWLLLPVENLPARDNPWEPWYDKAFGFVVRANDEQQARAIAQENAGDETRGEFLGRKMANTNTPWIDPQYSTCVELTAGGDPGLVMMDFHAA